MWNVTTHFQSNFIKLDNALTLFVDLNFHTIHPVKQLAILNKYFPTLRNVAN